MESPLYRLIAGWIKSQELTPRRKPSAAVRCEPLEGRQLLSTMSLFKGQGRAAAPFFQQGQYGQVSTREAMASGNVQRFANVSATPSAALPGQGGQMGVVRAQGQFLGAGANRGGVGLRNGLGGRAMVHRLNVNSSMSAAPVNLTMASDATPLPLPGQAQGGTVATTEASTLQVAPADAPTVQVSQATPVRADAGNFAPGGPTGTWSGWAGGHDPVTFESISTLPAGADTGGGGAADSGQGEFVNDAAAPSDTLKAAFDKLHTDTQAIQDKSEVTPKLLAAVRKDFEAIQKAATSASDQDALKTLAATVESLDGQIPTEAQQTQLVADFTAVLKSQGITDQTLIDTAVADIQAVVAASHVTADDLATIAADRDAIEKAMQANANPEHPGELAPTAGEAFGGFLAGLTGQFDVMGPNVGPFVSFDSDTQFYTLPIAFSPAGGMDGFAPDGPMDLAFGTLPQGGQFHATRGGIGLGRGAMNGQGGPVRVAFAGGESGGQVEGASPLAFYANRGSGGPFGARRGF